MPELPEVQSFADALHQSYSGKKFVGVKFHRKDIRFPLELAELSRIFSRGQSLCRVWREGKQLILETSAGSVNVSLGMSGAFFPATVGKPRLHEHITLLFENGDALAFVDPRRFGFWKIRLENTVRSADPLCEKALLEVFQSAKAQRSMRSVKEFLMDQSVIGGIGNIYALEALFRAGIHPALTCAELSTANTAKNSKASAKKSEQKWKSLAQCLPVLLNEAIRAGGSSISTYRKLHGESGGFQDLHQVYGREGKPCVAPGCKGIIERFAQGGRSSWVCARCQPLSKASGGKK